MTLRARAWFRICLFVVAAVLATPAVFLREAVGQAHVDKGGTVGIQNETERNLFFSLICMCGCPRETLGTCTCDYSGERRAELRELLEQGMGIDAIQKAYEKKFGSQALAVPPNRGANPLMWIVPLVALIAGAFGVVRLLKRWAATGAEAKPAGKPASQAEEEAYDKRLDDELRDLDKE